MAKGAPSYTCKILVLGFLAAVGSTGLLAAESGIETLPAERSDDDLPGDGHLLMRVHVQLVWDGIAGKLERRRYEFADPFATQYDVSYLPLDPPTDKPGLISGSGVLTWWKKGGARFGEDTIIAQYRGNFAKGRFEGQGALLMRGGFRYDGGWKNGRMEGHGQLLLPNGDAYTGDFLAGKRHGQGQYIMATGHIYEGGFAAGLRDGKGTVTEPGRQVYSSIWRGGREDLSLRQMLPGRMELAQSTDSAPDLAVSLSALASNGFCCYGRPLLGYTAASYPDRLRIFPDAPQMLEVWRGKQNIVVRDALAFESERKGLDEYSFRNYVGEMVVPVGMQLGIENLGTARAGILGAYVDISQSELDGEPALQSLELNPVSGQNLSFSIENYGWAVAEKTRLSFSYVKPQSGEKSERLAISIGDIKSVQEFSFVGAMRTMRADPKTLPKWEYKCGKAKESGTEAKCLEKIKDSGSLGRLVDYVFADGDKFGFLADGSLDFSWRDNSGALVPKSAPFSAFIPLGSFSVLMAECGEGADEVAAAPRKPFELKVDGKSYRLPLPIKGELDQGVLKRWSIKLNAAKSSRHRFTIVFELADGRLARSRPIELEFFRPQSFPGSLREFHGEC